MFQVTQSDSENSDEELDDILDKYDKNSRVIETNVPSLRVDLIIKTAFGLSRK